MGIIIFLVAMFLVACACFVVGFLQLRKSKSSESKRIGGGAFLAGAAAFAVFAASLFMSSLQQVPTKEFGVVTSFGKPDGVLSNGVHFIAPWKQVTEMDASIQTDNHTADRKDCINVRIAHQATACVDASIRWRIKSTATDSLFQNYRGFENIRESLVDRELSSTLNNAFANYDALGVDEKGNMTAPPLSEIAKKVTKDMQTQVGDQIDVLNVIIPVIKFDDNTQNKVNALLSQVAQTRIAQQGVRTSEEQAKANKELSASVSNDPNVLVSKCLDMVESGKVQLPAGFSCWPGSGSSVVVSSSK